VAGKRHREAGLSTRYSGPAGWRTPDGIKAFLVQSFLRHSPESRIVMRTMLNVQFPVEASNAAVKEGRLMGVMASPMERLKPEAAGIAKAFP
jgi:hypothetical protein